MSDQRNPEKDPSAAEQSETSQKDKKPEVKGKRLRTGTKGGGGGSDPSCASWGSIPV